MPANIDVLTVTATRVESLAVMAACEKATQREAAPTSFAGRIYQDLGEINHSRVLMLQTEVGSGGLGASQQAVQEAIAALHPRAVIMVGIAFGVDESKQVIGEVLVSEQLSLYDLQRIGTDDKGGERIVPRGDKPHASVRLLNYLRSAHNYWEGPTVTFGLLVSGARLVDNIDFRQQLRSFEPEAIGGEMEGAGLYVSCQGSNTDWILVKAICDWADGNKSIDKASRQMEAARNSAQFVLFALQHAQLPQLDQQQVVSSITDPNSDVAAPALAPPRLTIRESSAAEINASLKGITLSHEFRAAVDSLYIGRWTREPGWQATVYDLPDGRPGGRWNCNFEEVGSGALIFASTSQDLSALRRGDLVAVSGNISGVSMMRYISLDDANIRNVPIP
jgi:nucleoside phosphorylase